MYRAIYTGILAEFRRDDIDFIPHLALGLFVKDNARYDWNNPRESDFDEQSYRSAIHDAEELHLDLRWLVEELHLIKLPDEVIEWANGRRPNFSTESRAIHVRNFRLGERAADLSDSSKS